MVFINQIALIDQQDDNYRLFNKSKIDLNAHSNINTVKKEMMAEQITTKEVIP